MKKRSDSIKPVLGVAEQAESKAGEQFARHQENHRRALTKLDELKAYLSEYSARVNANTGDTFSPVQLQDNRAFLSRLSDIIRIQDTIVLQQAQHLETARQQWLSARQQAQSLDRLAGQYRQEEQAHAERVEQHASDELSSVRHSWLLRQRVEGF